MPRETSTTLRMTDRASGRCLSSDAARITVGSDPRNDLVIDAGDVAPFHLVLERGAGGFKVRDLGSPGGTHVRGLRVGEAWLAVREVVRVGSAELELELGREAEDRVDGFGPLAGDSDAVRRLFRILERIAPSDATVLIEGPTGAGKSLTARALHSAGPRRDGPFVVVDCGALAPTLVESELFGHERGAFTGAESGRAGAFEVACHGTLFLDEIGELPLDVQPKFLRALEDRLIKRIGTTETTPIDVRLIAATNRDLTAEVREGRFRADLFYRLNVVQVRIPALRERRQDIPILARRFLRELAPGSALELDDEVMAALCRAPWPGNVRELRTAIERAALMGDRASLLDAAHGTGESPALAEGPSPGPALDDGVAFRDAKRTVVEAFERRYLSELLERASGNLSAAARIARMDRNYLRTLVQRHALA